MTFVNWDHIITAATLEEPLQEAFARLRDLERHEVGHSGQTGTVADHDHVVQIHNDTWDGEGPVTEQEAWRLVAEHGYSDCACAIQLITRPGEPSRWLVFGKSRM